MLLAQVKVQSSNLDIVIVEPDSIQTPDLVDFYVLFRVLCELSLR